MPTWRCPFPRRRTLVWRYFIVAAFVVYVVSITAFIPLLSSTPKSRLDLPDPAEVPTVVTRNHSVAPPPPASAPVAPAAGGDGPRSADSAKPTTKKPTALEVLHKNMTLHKANMSDLLRHVKAAVANRSGDNDTAADLKVHSYFVC